MVSYEKTITPHFLKHLGTIHKGEKNMPIAYEEVDNLARLPFKFFKRSNYAPKAPTHWHTGIEIDYLVSGEDFKVVIAGQTHHYNSGDIWAIDRSQIHAATGHKDRSYYVMGMIIDNTFLEKEYPSSKNWRIKMEHISRDTASYRQLRKNLITIAELVDHPISDSIRFLILSEFFQMIVLIDSKYTEKTDITTPPNQSLADTVIAYIANNSSTNITAQSIAEHFRISQVTLNKELSQVTKLPLGKYLKQVRLMHARYLLLSTNYSVTYIANYCGFSSAKVLERNFKAWKKMTPSQYRKAFSKYFNE